MKMTLYNPSVNISSLTSDSFVSIHFSLPVFHEGNQYITCSEALPWINQRVTADFKILK